MKGECMEQRIIYRQKGKDYYHNIWHTIGQNMLIYIHAGTGRIVCSEKSYPIESCVLCFVGSRKLHYTLSDDPACYERSKVFAENEELYKILAFFKEKEKMSKLFHEDAFVYAFLTGEDAAEAERLLREIRICTEQGSYATAVSLSDYIRLLILLDKNILESIAPSSGHIYKAIEYINGHITEKLEIEDICAAVPISKYYFCREFKKTTGMTVMEYILKTRITLAGDMLLKEELSVSEISESCGFSSISFFCRCFKQETGKTPLQYRKGSSGGQ